MIFGFDFGFLNFCKSSFPRPILNFSNLFLNFGNRRFRISFLENRFSNSWFRKFIFRISFRWSRTSKIDFRILVPNNCFISDSDSENRFSIFGSKQFWNLYFRFGFGFWKIEFWKLIFGFRKFCISFSDSDFESWFSILETFVFRFRISFWENRISKKIFSVFGPRKCCISVSVVGFRQFCKSVFSKSFLNFQNRRFSISEFLEKRFLYFGLWNFANFDI